MAHDILQDRAHLRKQPPAQGPELRESEILYGHLIEGLAAAAYTCDAEGRITRYNEAAVELWGRRPEIGKDLWSGAQRLCHPDGDPLPLEEWPMAVALKEGRPVCGEEIVIERPDGSRRMALSHAQPIRDAAGAIVGGIDMMADITEHKYATQLLSEQSARIHAIVDSVVDAIITINSDGTIESLNAAAEKMFGYTADELVGQSVNQLMPSPYRDMHDQYLRDYLQTGLSKVIGIGREAKAVRKDGTIFPVDLSISEVKLGSRRLFTGVVRDITERKRAEQALRDSEARFRTVAMKAPVAIFIKDLEGRYTLANPLACEALGRPDDAVGKTDYDLLPADVADRLRRHDEDVIASGCTTQREDIVEREGYRRTFLAVKFPLFDADGQAVSVCGVAVDITARKQAEEALRESEQRFRALASNAPVGIFQTDTNGKAVFVNENWCGMTGLTLEEALGDGWKRALHPDDRERVLATWAEAVRKRVASQAEFRFKRTDGTVTWLQGNAIPLRSSGGQLLGYLGTLADITERKKAEAALQESEARFRDLANNAPVLIWVNGPDGCEFVNHEYLRFVGGALDEVSGMRWTQFLHPDDTQAYVEEYQQTVKRQQTFEAQIRFRRFDGEYRWLRSTGIPRFREDGTLLGYIGCSVDITDIKKSEHALREADRRKDEFLAVLAHELRNPLAPICTGLELLREAAENRAMFEEVCSMMQSQSQQLVRLVDDLLDVSRITRGAVELRRSRVDLAGVVSSAVEAARPAIDQSGHQLTVSLPEEPVVLYADPTRLAQVFSNLLNNAAKYTPPQGQVYLSAERQASEVVVTVSDNGIGIPPNMLRSIFEMFAQADRSMEGSQGGLGIGLTLVKQLVEMHSGSVEAHSAGRDQGSEFVVRLPLLVRKTPLPRGTSGEDSATSARLRILVVDDSTSAATVLSMLLETWGHEVHVAHDGLAAIDLAARIQPDVVLLDLGMPLLNGYLAAQRIREQPWGQNVLLVALTGWGQAEDRERTKAAGFDHHLVKPVDTTALKKLLAEREPIVADPS